MSGNSPHSTPITPFPDPPSRCGEEPEPVTGRPDDSSASRNVTKPSTSSADDLSLLLAQSAPDPYLTEGEMTNDPADPGKPRADFDGAGPVSPLGALSASENDARHHLLAFTGYAARVASAFGRIAETCWRNAERRRGAPDFLAACTRVELRQRF